MHVLAGNADEILSGVVLPPFLRLLDQPARRPVFDVFQAGEAVARQCVESRFDVPLDPFFREIDLNSLVLGVGEFEKPRKSL